MYEGYKYSQWILQGENWIVDERQDTSGDTMRNILKMKPAESGKKYPFGVFQGEIIDKNG